jgi:hypothetical protein
MSTILESESIRLAEQQRLDRLKTAQERNKWGQFATPPALALDIAKYAWSKLRNRKGMFCFLDPAIGTGSFYAAFLQAFPQERIQCATGIELDKAFAQAAKAIWEKQGLRTIQGDFTKQQPENRYNVILTNPPYVRHHHLSAEEKERLGRLVYTVTGLRLSGLAGLYCYFLLIAHAWLADNGLAVWLIPSEFMDVNYGDEVKRYLTERVCLLRVHRFCPSDVQFVDALVSSAIVCFENRTPRHDHEAVFSFGGTLMEPAKSEPMPLEDLRETKKWGLLPRQAKNGQRAKAVLLGDLFTVKRGLATGNNSFFIVPKNELRHRGIPLACVRPILPSPRFLRQEIIDADEEGWPILPEQLALIDCPLNEEEVKRKWPRFWEYLAEGKRQGVHDGYLASRRCPWYSQEKRDVAPFLCTYMGRSLERPFRFLWNKSQATAANVYLLLYPKAHVARAVNGRADKVFSALQAVHPEDFFSEGRVYGGGLHKMEPAELGRLPADALVKILGVKPEQQRMLF